MKSRVKGRNFILFCLFALCLCPLSASARQHKRIVSLAPSITESLYQLGAEAHIVGVTSYCNYPQQAREKQVVGTIVSPSIEAIYALSPDLILTVKGVNRPQVIEQLERLGLEVVVFDESRNFDDIAENFVQLGELVDRRSEAEKIIREVRREVNFIMEKTKKSPRQRVFWEVAANPLVTVGRGSFANDFIRYSGGINVFSDSLYKYPRINREEVMEKNPQVIILVTMGDVTQKEKEYWRRFKELEAVKFEKIYVVDADKVCRPTPISFLTGLKEIAGLLEYRDFEEND